MMKKVQKGFTLIELLVVIAIIGSTEGENIQFLGAQWGHAWGIGQEDEDNGILVLLAHPALESSRVNAALADCAAGGPEEPQLSPAPSRGKCY